MHRRRAQVIQRYGQRLDHPVKGERSSVFGQTTETVGVSRWLWPAGARCQQPRRQRMLLPDRQPPGAQKCRIQPVRQPRLPAAPRPSPAFQIVQRRIELLVCRFAAFALARRHQPVVLANAPAGAPAAFPAKLGQHRGRRQPANSPSRRRPNNCKRRWFHRPPAAARQKKPPRNTCRAGRQDKDAIQAGCSTRRLRR